MIIYLIYLIYLISGCLIGKTDNCVFCPYYQYLTTSLNCQDTLTSLYIANVYIRAEGTCTSTCEGTKIDPYNNIIQALLDQELKSNNHLGAQITFNFDIGDHFITEQDLATQSKFFRRKAFKIIFQPYDQNAPNDESVSFVQTTSTPIIYVKTDKFTIFIGYYLKIYNIIFDGIDLPLLFQNTLDQTNEKSVLCTGNSACIIAEFDFLSTPQTNGLFTIETLYDMNHDIRINEPNQIYKDFIQSNNKYFTDLNVRLILQKIVFRNFYIGLKNTNYIMSGFKSLIQPQLGLLKIILSTVTINNCFMPNGMIGVSFPDSIYLSNSLYLQEYAVQITRNLLINTLTIINYNQEQIGRIGTNQFNYKIVGSIFNLIAANYIAQIDNISITSSLFNPLFQNNPVYGTILTFIMISGGTLNINTITCQNLKNIQLLSATSDATTVINNGIVSNAIIPVTDTMTNSDETLFFIYSEQSTLTLNNIQFQSIVGNLIKIFNQPIQITNCKFSDSILISKQRLIFISSTDSNQGLPLTVQNTIFDSISVAKMTPIFLIFNNNKLFLEQCSFNLLENFLLVDSPNQAFLLTILSTQFTNLKEFSMKQSSRVSLSQWDQVDFINITSSLTIQFCDGTFGPSPQQSYTNLLFQNIQAPSIFNMQTVYVNQSFTNITIKDVMVTENMFSFCCFFRPIYTNVIVTNSKFQIFLKLSTSIGVFENFTYIQSINQQSVLVDLFFSAQVTVNSSTIQIDSGSLVLVQGSQLSGVYFYNCKVSGFLHQLFNIQKVNAIVLDSNSFRSQSIQSDTLLMDVSQIVDTIISNNIFDSIKSPLINYINSQALLLNYNIFSNVNCGTLPCFALLNQFGTIEFQNNLFYNFTCIENIFKIQYSNQFNFISNKIINATLNTIMYILQTSTQVKGCILNNIYSNQSLYVLQFVDSNIIQLQDISIINNNQTLGKGSISASLINELTLSNITMNGMNFVGDLQAINLLLFQKLSIKSLYFYNIVSEYSILYIETALKNLQVYAQDIICEQNVAKFSSCLTLITESEFYIFKLVANHNQGTQLYIKSDNQVYVDLSVVSIQNIYNSLIQSNNRVIQFEGCKIGITDMTLFNIQDNSPILYFLNSIIRIRGSQFTKLLPNNSTTLSLTFLIDSGQLTIYSSQFITYQDVNSTPTSNQFMKSNNALITLQHILVQGYNWLLYEISQSSFSLTNSLFLANDGSSIFKSTDSSLELANILFEIESQQAVFKLTSSDSTNEIYITNVTISYQTLLTLGTISSFALVSMELFQIIPALSIQGVGLQLTEIIEIKINQSIFQNLKQENGGCLMIESTKQNTTISISATNFKGCSATYSGGAIFLNKQISGSIYQMNCQMNTAQIGGCLSYNGTQSQLLVKQSFFTFNVADQYAGATMALALPLKEDQNQYFSNLAPSQQQGGTYGKSFKLVNLNINYMDSLTDLKKCNYIRNQINYTNQSQSITFASGQQFELMIALVDDYGDLVFNDIQSIATISANQDDDATLISNSVTQCQKGLFIYDQLNIIRTPGTTISLQLTLSIVYGSADQSSNLQFIEQKYQLNFTSRLCQKGEILNQDGSCLICSVDTYSLVDPHDSRLATQSCNYCPQNALCIQEAIYPKKGYWVLSSESNLVLKCNQADYCLGEEDLYNQRINATSSYQLTVFKEKTAQMYQGQCLIGHQNALCEECISGYFKFTQTSPCLPCQGNKAATMLVIVLVFCLLMYYSIYQSEKYMQKNQEGQDKAVLIKIFVNYFQTLTLLGSVNLNWTKSITQILDFGSDFFGTQFNFISLQCLQTGFIGDQEQMFYMNLLLQVGIPFLIFFINCLYFIVQIIINWKNEQSRQRKKTQDLNKSQKSMKKVNEQYKIVSIYIIVLNAVVCVHLFYSLLTSTPTQLFYCQTVSEDSYNNQIQYLTKNLNIQCWTPNFSIWFYCFGILLSMLFGLGIPIILAVYMYIYRMDLSDFDNKQSTSYVLGSSKKKSEINTYTKAQSILVKKEEAIEVVSLEKKQQKQSGITHNLQQSSLIQSQPFIYQQQSQISQKTQPLVTGLGILKDYTSSYVSAQKTMQQQQQQMSEKSKSEVDTQKFSKHQTVQLAQLRKSKFKSAVSKISAAKSLRQTIKKSKIKKSEVFLFLVDPYKSNVFFWEIIVLLRKFVLIIIGLLIGLSDSQNNSSLKYLLLNIYLIVFFKLNLIFDPYYSPLFNTLENYSFIAIICSCISGIISSVFDTLFSEILADLVFIISNALFILLMIIAFSGLLYMDGYLDELQKEPQTRWKLIVKLVLRKHKKRTDNTIDSIPSGSKFIKESKGSKGQEVIPSNPME